MASLNWIDQKDDDGRVFKSIATYNAYETPSGPAQAEARAWSDGRYETWIHDPYLEENGVRNCFEKFAYGTDYDKGNIDGAKEHCEGYGYECALNGLDFFDIRQLYIKAFRQLAYRYVLAEGFFVTEVIGGPGRDLKMHYLVVDEGDEPARVVVWMDDDFSLRMGYK